MNIRTEKEGEQQPLTDAGSVQTTMTGARSRHAQGVLFGDARRVDHEFPSC